MGLAIAGAAMSGGGGGAMGTTYMPICLFVMVYVAKNEIKCMKEKMNMEALIEYDYKTK